MKRIKNFIHRKFLYSLALIVLVIGILLSYHTAEARKASLNQEVDRITAAYKNVFADAEMTMIVADLDSETYELADEMRMNLPKNVDQSEFDQWQQVLDTQFENQEEAKNAVISLIEEIDGTIYVKRDLVDTDFTEVKTKIEQPFNEQFQSTLLNQVTILEEDWKQSHLIKDKIESAVEKIDETNSDSLTTDDWESLEKEIDQIINPNTKSKLNEHAEALKNKWVMLEKQRIAAEKRKLEEEKRMTEEKAAETNEKSTAKTTEVLSSSTNPSKNKATSNKPASSTPVQTPKNQSESEPAPAPKPVAKEKPSIGANKIGINGIYKNYTNYGNGSTAHYQSGIDAGLIIAGFRNFNGNDGETTYFAGHNPGIMNFMANNIHIGAVVTVTDSAGKEYKYKMIDKVDVDDLGNGMLNSIGQSAIDAYYYGTGTESILIQFCNTSNGLMSFWYGPPI